MTPNWLLIWTVMVSCVAAFGQIAMTGFRSPVRLTIPLLVSAVLGISYYFAPNIAGYTAGIVWFAVMLLPGLLFRWSDSLLGNGHHSLALTVTRIAVILHPFDDARDKLQLSRAIALLKQGSVNEGLGILEMMEHKPTSIGRAAAVLKIRHLSNWETFINSINSSQVRSRLLKDPLVADLYLQSLGETGQLEAMLESYEKLSSDQRRVLSVKYLNLTRMKVSAFAGRDDLVVAILNGPLKSLNRDSGEFWRATALQARGESEEAAEVFRVLEKVDDSQIVLAAKRRLATPVHLVEDFATDNAAILESIQSTVEHESRYTLFGHPVVRRSWATILLSLTLIAAFIAEMLHGPVFQQVFSFDNGLTFTDKLERMLENSRDINNLVECGALVLPWSIYPDDWWRVFNAAFLHFGLTHLCMNLFGLILFGPRLERAWGSIVTGVSYLVCAVLSIALMTFFVDASPTNPITMVGASGGVMGIIGCLLGYMGRGMLLKRNSFVSRDFNLLLMMVMLQFVFDRVTPRVSSACHIAGLLIGLSIGLIIGFLHEFRSAR
ncbi:rhomboid family intramembrane serine protease [Thalassoglobus sp. JC818]|uniref:rhomboid family intramembrane serine protease n=1 Tax=Thalassoglobus sp. JC818 TaxID=3232136 RepID=UPI00345B30AA